MNKFSGIAAAFGVLTLPMAALAAGNNVPGDDRYYSNPGREQAQSHNCGPNFTDYAAAGAFGYLGKDQNNGIKSYPNDPGADQFPTTTPPCGERPSRTVP